MKRALSILIFFLILAAALAFWTFSSAPQSAQAQQMFPTPVSDRFAAWPTVYSPTQADNGAQVYWARCMMCHGDRGQGLNQDWLSAMDPPDRNCWKSNCHGPHHGPNGFTFPKVVPAIIGKGALAGFPTGLDLYNFISKKMPFQEPGGLQKPVYLELTAYLLRQNGYFDGKEPLDEQRLKTINLSSAPQPPSGTPWQVWAPYLAAGAALLVFLAALGISLLRARRKNKNSDNLNGSGS